MSPVKSSLLRVTIKLPDPPRADPANVIVLPGWNVSPPVIVLITILVAFCKALISISAVTFDPPVPPVHVSGPRRVAARV